MSNDSDNKKIEQSEVLKNSVILDDSSFSDFSKSSAAPLSKTFSARPKHQITAAEGLIPLPDDAEYKALSKTKSEILLSKKLPRDMEKTLLCNQIRAGNHEIAKRIERIKAARLASNPAEASSKPADFAHASEGLPSLASVPTTQVEPSMPTRQKAKAKNKLKELTPEESNAELAAFPQPVVQRATIEIPEPPMPATAHVPQRHPDFAGATSQLRRTGEREKNHEPTAQKQGAILESVDPPDNETETLAESNQVGKMDEAHVSEFDKKAFIDKLSKAAAGITPKDESELKEFPNSGKAQGLKNDAKSEVKNSQETAQKDLQKTSNETPKQGDVTAKPVTPLNTEKPGTQPQVSATQVVPDAKPAEASDLSYGPKAIEQKMAESDPAITEDVMKKVPDEKINSAVAQKEDLDKKVEQATRQFRQQEQNIRNNAQTDIQSGVTQGVMAIHNQRTQDFGEVSDQQTTSKGKDDAKYQQVMGELNKIYDDSKKEVDDILKGLPDKVNVIFDIRADVAARKMNTSIQGEIDDLKRERNDVSKQGIGAIGNAINNNTKSVPKELVEPIYSRGKNKYLADMREIATQIASIIDCELKLAKKAIAVGKQKGQNYLKVLPEDLQEIGEQAADEINSKYDELGDKAGDAVQELESSMTEKFQEANQADAMLNGLREKARYWSYKSNSFMSDGQRAIFQQQGTAHLQNSSENFKQALAHSTQQERVTNEYPKNDIYAVEETWNILWHATLKVAQLQSERFNKLSHTPEDIAGIVIYKISAQLRSKRLRIIYERDSARFLVSKISEEDAQIFELSMYIHRITRNVILDEIKKHSNFTTPLDIYLEAGYPFLADDSFSPEEKFISTSEQNDYKQLLEFVRLKALELSPLERKVFQEYLVLLYQHDDTYRSINVDIAKNLNISSNQVNVMLQRVRKKLRASLRKAALDGVPYAIDFYKKIEK